MERIVGAFSSSDGQHRCHYFIMPAVGEPKGIVQISHGMCEYIERYVDFAEFLSQMGYVVCANDHLGHGHTVFSLDELGYFSPVDGWQNAVRDLHRMTLIAKKRFPQLPLVLLGHSMGSFLARAYAAKYPHECSAFIFMGTADGFATNAEDICGSIGFDVKDGGRLSSAAIKLLLAQGEILAKLHTDRYRSPLLDKIGFGKNNERIDSPRTKYDWISRDEQIVDKYAADELCNYTFTVNGFINLASALWYVSNEKWFRAIDKSKPVMLLGGSCDPVGNYGKGVLRVARLLEEHGCNVTVKIYDGARHELLNEINREEVYLDIERFLSDVLYKKADS